MKALTNMCVCIYIYISTKSICEPYTVYLFHVSMENVFASSNECQEFPCVPPHEEMHWEEVCQLRTSTNPNNFSYGLVNLPRTPLQK